MTELDLEHFMPYRLTVTADRISRSLAKIYMQYDLTTPEWRIIAHLYYAQSLTPKVIGQMSNMEKARVTRGLILLEKKGLIKRCKDTTDKRITHITLSPQGLALHQKLEPEIVAWNEQFLQYLGPHNNADLLLQLQRIEQWCQASN